MRRIPDFPTTVDRVGIFRCVSAVTSVAVALALTGCAPEPEPPIPATVMIYPPITGDWDGSETIWRVPYLFDYDTPSSLTVIVNKRRPLADRSYAPANLVMPQGISNTNGTPLRAEAADALERMAADAKLVGSTLVLTSGYRSYETQTRVYNGFVESFGQVVADGTSAKPGHSEHQLGLAADLAGEGEPCFIMECFSETATGRWLASNAWKYGFVLRYPKNYTAVTGYDFEPWHFRYVGLDLARLMHETGYATLEDYLGFEPAPTYS